MLLTLFLALVFCTAMTVLLVAAVAFVQDERFFSSAPKEAVALLKKRDKPYKVTRIKHDVNERIKRLGVYYMCIDDLPL